MNAEAILKELHEIREERAQFVKYDRDRAMRKREKELWAIVKAWHMQTFSPEAWKAHQENEAKELARIETMNKNRTLSLKKKTA